MSHLQDIPPSRGLVMPAEWDPHQACLILYPHNPQTFRLEQAQAQVLQVAKAIATEGKEDVYLLVQDEEQKQKLLETNKDNIISNVNSSTTSNNNTTSVHVYVCPSNDTWVRDTGPTCCWDTRTIISNYPTNDDDAIDDDDDIKNPRFLIGLDWDFNAYGGPKEGCYWPCDLDQQIAKTICQDILKIPSLKVPLILEGGSIHTDGEGTLLVTKECLLNSNRNPQWSQPEIETTLKRTLGVDVVLWLPYGVDADEDTNGHVDNFCCFVKPGHVALAWTDNDQTDAENYKRCRLAEDLLKESTDAKGRSIQINKLYLPPSLKYTQEEAQSLVTGDDGDGNGNDDYIIDRQAGEKMAASYVNFYVANRAVIVPQFGVVETDGKAIETLRDIFPERTVVGVPSREILLGGGNIHCITQQVPARIP